MGITTPEGRGYVDLVVAEHIADPDSQIRDALDALAPDTGWISPTLLNGWVNFGGATDTAAYRKIGNQVFIKGLVKNGSATSGTPIFTLPAGFRPPNYNPYPTVSNNLPAVMGINGDSGGGNVEIISGSAVFFGLSVTYLAE